MNTTPSSDRYTESPKHRVMSKLEFNSDLGFATPAQVIFHMLERATREGKFMAQGPKHPMMSRDTSIDVDINDYVDRENRRAQVRELGKLRSIYDMLPALPGSKHDEFKKSLIALVDGRIADLDPDPKVGENNE